jgi:hypothetical protein
MVERRRIYLPLRAPFILDRCFIWILPVGFVCATWLRLRKTSKPVVRDPFPNPRPKARLFGDGCRSTAAMSISLSKASLKIVSPDPVDAGERAAPNFRIADLRRERTYRS